MKEAGDIMNESYRLFLKESGLTPEEAFDFLDMKIKSIKSELEIKDVDMDFIQNLSKEAKEYCMFKEVLDDE